VASEGYYLQRTLFFNFQTSEELQRWEMTSRNLGEEVTKRSRHLPDSRHVFVIFEEAAKRAEKSFKESELKSYKILEFKKLKNY